jgi:hypothetical protein
MMSQPNYRDYFGTDNVVMQARYDEVMAEIEASKCPCGGSFGGYHSVSWHEANGWEEAARREGIDL